MPTLENCIKEINASSKMLWILCGLPYSGKSFLAEKILKATLLVSVSIDEILKQKGFDWDSNKLPNETEWKEVFEVSYKKLQEALKNGSRVLYDSTNHTKVSREVLRKIAHEVGAETRVLYIDTPVETVWQRWEENRITKKRPVVDKKLVEMTIDSFEVPTSDENVLRIEKV